MRLSASIQVLRTGHVHDLDVSQRDQMLGGEHAAAHLILREFGDPRSALCSPR
jgi:hypothetical protein